MRPRTVALMHVLSGLLALAGSGTAGAVEIIVHPSVTVTQISRNYARSIFAAKVSRWEDGTDMQVFVLPGDSPVHQEMAKRLLDLYPYQLHSAWERVIYTGIGQAPIEVSSEAEMRKRVGGTRGAIGYLSKVQGHDNIRVLPIR